MIEFRALFGNVNPLHHRSRFLDGADPFGELVRGCRELGMVVLARTDPHATYDDVHEAHPDWIAVDAEGRRAPPCWRVDTLPHNRRCTCE